MMLKNIRSARVLPKQAIRAVRSRRTRYLCHRKIDAIFRHNAKLRKYAGGLSENDLRPVQSFWSELDLEANTKWHIAYGSLDEHLDPARIPEDLFYTWVEPRLNRMDLAQAYSDKNAYDRILPDARTPETVVRNISGRYSGADYSPLEPQQAIKIVDDRGKQEYIIKPALYSGGGKKVGIVGAECIGVAGVAQLFAEYGQDFVVQRRIEQHHRTSVFHPSSVNTLRPLTLRFGGRIELISCVFRTGNSGSRVDNQSAGGIACQVDADGRLKPFGIDKHLHRYEIHPATGESFGVEIPAVSDAVRMVLDAHVRLPHFDLVSWDIAIGSDGEPILIELNVIDQEINFHQAGGISVLGENTEALIQELSQRSPTMSLVLW